MTGVAKWRESSQTSNDLDAMLRPLDASGDLQGHFHAAVFPYRPFKKRTLDYERTTRELFESGSIQDVLHLLSDHRPQFGVGESEFLAFFFYVAATAEIYTQD